MKLRSIYIGRILLAIAIIVIMVTLTACTTSSTPSATKNTISTATPTATRTRPTVTRPPASASSQTAIPSPEKTTPITSTAPSGTLSPNPTSTPTTTPTSSNPIASNIPFSTASGFSPFIAITSPAYASRLPSGDVTVSVLVSDFNLVNKQGQPAVNGEGHILYYMDADPPSLQGQLATTAAGTFIATTDTSYTWHNVSPGVDYFSVELVNNDDTSLNPVEIFTEFVTIQGIATPSAIPSPSTSTP